MEQDRRFARLQRPEQLLVGLIVEDHLLIHGIGEVMLLILLALEQLFNVPGREGDLASVRVAKPADAHQPRAIGHIVRLLRCLGLAAQVKDEPQAQAVQQLTVSCPGQQSGGNAAVDLPPLDMLALVGLVAAQLPEVVSAHKGQLGARSRVLRCRLGGGAGQHREVVEGLCRAASPGRQGCRSPDDLHQVAPQQVKIGRVVVPPLHHRDAEGRQIFQQHVTHPVQLPPCPRLVAGQAGAELLLDQIVRLIEAGADLRVGRKALPGAGIPQGAEQILPQAGQQHPLAPQGRKRHPLLLPEGMAARHQQAGRVCPQGGAGQHRSRRTQIHHKARVQLALLHTIGHGIVFQQAEPHLNVGVLLAELVQLGLQPGQVVRHQ